MTTVRENLIAAKALIDTPEKWAHEDAARRYNGGNCLCAVDAVAEVVGNSWDECGERERDFLEAAVPPDFKRAPNQDEFLHRAAQFNDHPNTTHADILALFDRAIAAAEAAKN